MEKHSRVYAEIDLDAISYNMEQMKKRVGEGAKFIAVVKTDGYGHGAVPIACMLDDDPDVWGYATATLEEAVELHRAGIQKPTMVLGCVFPNQYEEMIKEEVRATVYTLDMAQEIRILPESWEKQRIFISRSIQGWNGSDFRQQRRAQISSGRLKNFRMYAWKECLRILQKQMSWIKHFQKSSTENLYG